MLVSGGYDESVIIWDIARGLSFPVGSPLLIAHLVFSEANKGAARALRPSDGG